MNYFTLIQFCPNHTRQEFVNVGVVLVQEDLIQFKINKNNNRAKRFFPKLNLKWLNFVKKGVANRIEMCNNNKEDFEYYVKTRANQIQQTILHLVISNN